MLLSDEILRVPLRSDGKLRMPPRVGVVAVLEVLEVFD
jgi:hypothetical protein